MAVFCSKLWKSNAGLPPIGTSLNDCTWEQIRAISDAGLASVYFSDGDRKAVTLNGTVGSLPFSNVTHHCFIIGIDHNSEIEGEKRIHFQFGFSSLSDGVPLTFVDSGYNTSKTSGSWFNINNDGSNSGGWQNSRMRTAICPAFKKAMPSDLQEVLKTVTKYSDNTGGGTDAESYVTATTDDIFLLAEYEIFGTHTYANSAEKNYQAQYAWYAAGNLKSKNKHDAISTAAHWWGRSTRATTNNQFCITNASGKASFYSVLNSCGFAPCFCV